MSSRKNRQSTTSGLSRRQQHNADKRRSANAVGLTDFSQKKGQVRALEEFKKRKNRKQLQTSMALRKYRKLMKQEGMEAGTGASRKRRANQDEGSEDEEVGWNDQHVNSVDDSDGGEEADERKANRKRPRANESDSDENPSSSDNDDGDSEEEKDVKDSKQEKQQREKKYIKPKKMDPFEKSRKKAELAKQKAEEAALRRASNEKDRQQKIRRRRQQTKLLQQRTKRGQPIMKHAINNLLYKLEKQRQEPDSEAAPVKHNTDHRRHKSKGRDFSKEKQTRRDNALENPPQKKKKKARKFY